MNTDERKELEDQIEDLGNRLASSFLETVDVVASLVAAEERFYEGSHSAFVADKSAAVARTLEFSPSEVYEIQTAALLHDIGKIGYPDVLLSKHVNEMGSAEFEYYARHPELGKIILSKHSGFDTIAEIVYQHHERLDGSGFPRHLKKSQIHPGANIIAVVDVYHNILHKRRRDKATGGDKALTSGGALLGTTQSRFGQAMNHLTQKSGTLYHPRVVDAFVTLIESERKQMGERTMMRIPVSQVKPGMILADDYNTTYGVLIAGRGETITDETIVTFNRFRESGELPQKILVLK